MDLSIIIPTRNRPQSLARTLAALDDQRLEGVSAELIVIQNGSDEDLGEPVGLMQRLPTRLLHGATAGAAPARNLGLSEARGDVVVFLGDDTRPANPELLRDHARLHAASPDARYAVAGRIAWDPRMPVTEFMSWLELAGFQFSFDALRPGPVAPSSYFYSSHASVKRSILDRVGSFDERFSFLLEDTDLGIRLEHDEVLLDYHPELIVYHDHPQDLDGFAARMEVIGREARRLRTVWPQDCPPEVLGPRPRWRLYPALEPLARWILRAGAGGWLRERAWATVLMSAYARGYGAAADG